MLTCDAFGVMPPIAKLTAEQAMYHFLSGYTAQVAGTEVGLGKEPKAVFSTCFGAPFMPRHPSEYAKMLGERIARYGARLLAGQHRLVGRRLRRRQAHGDRPHPRAACAPRSTAASPARRCGRTRISASWCRKAAPRSRATCSTRAAPGPTSAATTRPRAACAAGSKPISREFEPFVGSEVKRAAIRAAA